MPVATQVGGAKVEVLMVFTNVQDVDRVARTTPVFSGSASATAGDKGTGISAGGNPEVEGGVFTVSRSEGLYAGATGEALVVSPDEEGTTSLLGGAHDLKEVLVRRTVAVPDDAKPFVDAVREWQSGK